MEYIIFTHFAINATILIPYLLNKEEKLENIWKEVLTTILIGWIVVFMMDDE